MKKKLLVPRAERVFINREFSSIEQLIREYVTNVSRSGAFIRTKHLLPVGTKVNLRFSVIVDDIETIEGTGEVIRVSHKPPGMGIVFVELTAVSQRIITRLLSQRTTRTTRRGRPAGSPR
jgi:PilZ domain